MHTEQISWCTGLLNRLRFPLPGGQFLRLYENNIRSLLDLKTSGEDWCFCVADYESTDMDVDQFFANLQDEYKNKGVCFDYKTATIPQKKFTRGGARNEAYKLADFDTLFFLDADMLFTGREVVESIYKYTHNSLAYFPVCLSYKDQAHTEHYQRNTGKGNVGMSRETYRLNTKGWLEKKTWGREDDIIFNFYNNRKIAVRDCTGSFFHQWHPATRIGE
jgi:hypothetical protein